MLIVDLDTGFGDVTPMLEHQAGAHPPRPRARSGAGRPQEPSSTSCATSSPDLDVLAGPSALEWRTIKPDDLRRTLELLARYYDKVVLDTSGTLNEVSEIALDMATIVLWVTTSEFTSVRDSIDALRALDTLSIPRERMRIVLNASSPDDNVRSDTVEQVLQRDVFWQIPYDKTRPPGHALRPARRRIGAAVRRRPQHRGPRDADLRRARVVERAHAVARIQLAAARPCREGRKQLKGRRNGR